MLHRSQDKGCHLVRWEAASFSELLRTTNTVGHVCIFRIFVFLDVFILPLSTGPEHVIYYLEGYLNISRVHILILYI